MAQKVRQYRAEFRGVSILIQAASWHLASTEAMDKLSVPAEWSDELIVAIVDDYS